MCAGFHRCEGLSRASMQAVRPRHLRSAEQWARLSNLRLLPAGADCVPDPNPTDGEGTEHVSKEHLLT